MQPAHGMVAVVRSPASPTAPRAGLAPRLHAWWQNWATGLVRCFQLLAGLSCCLTSLWAQTSEPTATFNDVPLCQRIDALLVPSIPEFSAPAASDGQLLRRLSLDLRGVVPTKAELDAFVADAAPDRWPRWVKKFLADPLCDEHLVTYLDRTLMLRRPHSQVDRAAWLGYLREQVANNVGVDQLAKQMLYSDWWNREQRASQRFYLDRGGDPHLITRDLGRVFLGRDMQCAQCHDHPLIDGYRQIDYHGLLAFSAASSLVEVAYKDGEGKDQKVQLYVERAAGDAAFESVFEKGVPFRSGPRLPGQPEQFDAYLLPDQRYVAEPPTGAMAGVAKPPQRSRRKLLAEQLASRQNSAFVANWANRLWALLFGQGLVHPLDMHHPDNPPLHPELLTMLCGGLVECDMQPRKFLEQVVLTNAYQRGDFTSLPAHTLGQAVLNQPASPDDKTSAEVAKLRGDLQARLARLDSQSADLAAAESTALQEYETAREAWRTIQGQRAAVVNELDKAEAAMLDAKKKSTDAANVLVAAQKKLQDSQSRLQLLDEAAGKLQQAMDLGGAEDAELKQAVATAKQRSETVRGQQPAIEKAVADAQAAVNATGPVLAAATSKVQEIVGSLNPVIQSLATADTAMTSACDKWSTAKAAVQLLQQNSQQMKRIVAWLDSLDAVQLAKAELAQAETNYSRSQPPVDSARLQVAATHKDLGEAQTAEQLTKRDLASATQALDKHNADLTQLQQSIDALIASTKLVSPNETLVVAQQSIQAELDKRRMQVGQLQAAVDKATSLVSIAAERVRVQSQAVSTAQAKLDQAAQEAGSARIAVDQKQSELQAIRGQCQEHWTKATDESSRRFSLAGLQPLSPEQLCWSTLRVTGQFDAYVQVEASELEKQSPLATDADDAAKLTRHREAVRKAMDKLRGNADVFVSLYSSGPDKTQDDFFASADQALYTANAGSVFAWAGPGNNNPTQLAIAATDAGQVAQTLYWGLLCRQPTEAETQLVAEQLTVAGDGRNAVIHEMAWAILASAEFRFCH